MSITTIFDFSTPSNYTLNDVDISGSIASLSLVPNPGQIFSQAFSSSSGFTFNPSNTSIGSGSIAQVDLRPSNATFFANYVSSLNANWGNGSLIPSNNGAVLGTNVMELLGGVSTKYIDYSATGNAQSTQTGCVRLIYIPNYSGTPGTYQLIYRACQAVGNTNNLVAFFHNLTGQLSMRMFDASGTQIIASDFGSFNPTSGTRYEIELNWDITTGQTRLFLDGVQLGSTLTETGTRSSSISLVRIGEDATPLGAVAYANFSITDIVIFSTVQHTSNYSAPSPLPSSIAFAADVITFPPFNYSGLGALIAFSAFTTGGDVNSPGYILNGLYWNGTMWVSSNGTYAQSNPKATIASNIATLPANNTLTIQVITTSGSSPMSIAGPLRVTYTTQNYPTLGGSILSNVGLNVEDFISFAANLSESGSDTVTFALKVNGTLMYWNGSAWVSSNGTAAQTNTVAVILAHIPTLLTVNSVVNLYALLVSGTGSTSPSLTTMTVVYDFGSPLPTSVATTIVFGFLADITGLPVVGAQVIFSLVNILPNAYMEGADHILIAGSVTATTDANGYFQQAVIATTQFEGTNTFIQVVVKKGTVVQNVGPDGNPLYLTIPIQANIDITTLLSA